MIYLCKGCDQICKGCGKTCEEVCSPCAYILDRPLGGFVLLALLTNIPAAACAGLGVLDEQVRDCEDPLMLLCCVNVLLAIIHCIFAFYLQHRLVYGLSDAKLTPGTAGATPPTGGFLTSKQLMDRMGSVMLYDVGVCLYIFVFIGSFFLNSASSALVADCRVDSALPGIAGVLLVLFAVLTVVFAFFWYCAVSCDACCGQNVSRPPQPVVQGRPVQQQHHSGLTRMVFGKSTGFNAMYGRPAGQPPPVTGAPVQYGMAPGAAPYAPTVQATPVYGAPPPGQPMAYATPVQGTAATTKQGPSATQQVVGGGLSMAGKGLQKVGNWLGGGSGGQQKGRG